MRKLGENVTTYYWYCLLDNSHEKPFQKKTMDELWGQYVSLIFPTKILMGKIENMTHAYVNITSLKTLTRNLMSKTCERKEYNMILVQVSIYEMSPPDSCKFRRRRIPILYRNFLNIEVGRDLVNSSARLSHAVICKMFISPLSCNLWG